MRTVFLDFDSLRPADLDTGTLHARLPQLTLFDDTARNEVAERMRGAEAVVVNKIRLGRDDLEGADGLRLVCLAATGTDNIDLDAAAELGIGVCNIRDYCTPSVVQHVFALLLTLTQELDAYRTRVRAGDWQRSPQFCLLDPPFRELAGKTLGIVGYGSLGSGVARVASAFGMRVVAAALPGRRYEDDGPVERMPLAELIESAQVISLHCPLNDDTRQLIDAEALKHMRSDALLINTARGGLVDAEALVRALEAGQIAGAAVDVLEQEPPRDGDPLLSARLPNLIVTPHMAWAARESRQRALDQILENILAFAEGRSLNRVD